MVVPIMWRQMLTTDRSKEPATVVFALTAGNRIQKQIIGILKEKPA